MVEKGGLVRGEREMIAFLEYNLVGREVCGWDLRGSTLGQGLGKPSQCASDKLRKSMRLLLNQEFAFLQHNS